jgi:FkbH-like protein
MIAPPPIQVPVLNRVRELVKQGNASQALQLIAAAARAGDLAPEDWEKAGRLVKKHKTAAVCRFEARVLMLGQFTTSWLSHAFTAVGWGDGCGLEVAEGDYDSVLQTLLTWPDERERPQVVVLLPWTQRLLSENHGSDPVSEELGFWRRAWSLISEKLQARILQVGYDWLVPGPMGHHLSGAAQGEIGQIRRMNEALRAALPEGAFLVDLEQVSGGMGRDQFYDLRRYFWTKQPFSEAGAHLLASHLWAGTRALLVGPKKVLVLDLDNTLWGGVVAETGPLGIALGETPEGEAYRHFQHHIQGLRRRGVVLAICSKNNPEDGLAPFTQNPQMLLKATDFAHAEIGWEPKSAGLRRIAKALNLGLDSFVFFDDNPAEREEVRQALPEVAVVEVPAEPSEYVRVLERGLWFETTHISETDRKRGDLYQKEIERRGLEESAASMADYLASLSMVGAVGEVDETSIQRVVQLLGKTNQFNLTTRRHSLDQVRRMIAAPGSVNFVFHLSDKFGDYGLVAVLLAVPSTESQERTLHVDTWLMSCRVIGRTAEQFVFNALVTRAREMGYGRLSAEYLPTPKNVLVKDLLDRLGFTRRREMDDGGVFYDLSLEEAPPAETWVVAAAVQAQVG